MPPKTEEALLRTSNLGDIVGSYEYSGPFKNAVSVANHYGFHLIKPIKTPGVKKRAALTDMPVLRREDSLNFYTTKLKEKVRNPVFLFHTLHPRRKEGLVSFDIIGYDKPFAEALTLKSGSIILSDRGFKDIFVDINALGNTQNWENFVDSFSHYYRSHYEKLGPCCRELFKTDNLAVSGCNAESCLKLYGRAPKPIDFLSGYEMNYLRGVLEYLEILNIPYRINHRMIGNRADGTRLLFSLKSKDKKGEPMEVGFGEHYKLKDGTEERKPTAGVHLTLRLKGGKTERYSAPKKKSRPTVYFMHIGTEAKRKSVDVLEMLRDINAKIVQSIFLDTLSDQITHARRHRIHIGLIMGVKEVREETIIVRDIESQSQSTVSLSRLKSYLRRVLKKFKG